MLTFILNVTNQTNTFPIKNCKKTSDLLSVDGFNCGMN